MCKHVGEFNHVTALLPLTLTVPSSFGTCRLPPSPATTVSFPTLAIPTFPRNTSCTPARATFTQPHTTLHRIAFFAAHPHSTTTTSISDSTTPNNNIRQDALRGVGHPALSRRRRRRPRPLQGVPHDMQHRAPRPRWRRLAADDHLRAVAAIGGALPGVGALVGGDQGQSPYAAGRRARGVAGLRGHRRGPGLDYAL